jgi:hypothetical protein
MKEKEERRKRGYLSQTAKINAKEAQQKPKTVREE